MNKYETVMILSKEVSNEERKKALEKIKECITKNGEITKTEDIGLKTFAYEIRKQKEGYYYLIEFNSPPSNISELERIYRITDAVLKFITVKLDN